MDFSENLMQDKGHGDYCYLKPKSFPSLFLAYLTDPSDSGRIHSDVYTRWSNGDRDVIEGKNPVCWFDCFCRRLLSKEIGYP